MLFEVTKLRLEGRRLKPGWVAGQRRWRGNLQIAERLDPVSRRNIPQAWMRHSKHQDVEELGTLYDVRVLHMGEVLILTGFEREAMMVREFIQDWELRPITEEEMNTPLEADVVRGRGPKTAP